jgi:hypothetical protein
MHSNSIHPHVVSLSICNSWRDENYFRGPFACEQQKLLTVKEALLPDVVFRQKTRMINCVMSVLYRNFDCSAITRDLDRCVFATSTKCGLAAVTSSFHSMAMNCRQLPSSILPLFFSFWLSSIIIYFPAVPWGPLHLVLLRYLPTFLSSTPYPLLVSLGTLGCTIDHFFAQSL